VSLTKDQFNQQVQTTPPQNLLTFNAGDLQTALGLPYVPVQPTIAWFDVVVGNLHLRSTAYIDPNNPKANIIEGMADGTVVGVLDGGAAIVASGYDWLHVQSPTGRIGYAAKMVNGQPTLIPKSITPTTPRKLIGVHCLQDGENAVASFLAALPAGYIIPSATVVNEPKILTLLAGRVKYLLYRSTLNENPPPIPDDFAAAVQVGRQRATSSLAWINTLPKNVYPIDSNERKWSPGHGGFWLGYLETLNANGRKGCIGSYGVGQPEPAQWATMTEALQHAMANGHLVVLHSYCQAGTTPGMLSADTFDYEQRHVKLFNAVPANARPDLILSEDGHEFSRGLFEGATPLVTYSDKLQQADQQYPWLQSRNKWTFGGETQGWGTSSIDSAAVPLANFISTGRYP